MKLIETTISGQIVRMLYADAPSKDEASEWVEMRVKVEQGDDNRRLGVIQTNALRRLQALIAEENKRFQLLADQSRQ